MASNVERLKKIVGEDNIKTAREKASKQHGTYSGASNTKKETNNSTQNKGSEASTTSTSNVQRLKQIVGEETIQSVRNKYSNRNTDVSRNAVNNNAASNSATSFTRKSEADISAMEKRRNEVKSRIKQLNDMSYGYDRGALYGDSGGLLAKKKKEAQAEIKLLNDELSGLDNELRMYKYDEPNPLERVGLTIRGAARQTAGELQNTGAIAASYIGKAFEKLGVMPDEEKNAALLEDLERAYATANPHQRKAMQPTIDYVRAKAEGTADKYLEIAYAKEIEDAIALSEKGAQDVERAKTGLGDVGAYFVDLGAGATQMGLDAALGFGNIMLPMAARVFGSSAGEAITDGAEMDDAVKYGASQAAKEYIIEKLFSFAKPLKKIAGKGIGDEALEKLTKKFTFNFIKSAIGRETAQRIMRTGLVSTTEAAEEIIASVADPYLKNWIYSEGETVDWNEALYSGLVGGGLGGIFGGVGQISENRAYSKVGEEMQSLGITDDIIQTGLESAENTDSYKDAKRLQEMLEAGQEISKADIGKLYVENVRTINRENGENGSLNEGNIAHSNATTHAGKDAVAGDNGFTRGIIPMTNYYDPKTGGYTSAVRSLGDNGAKALREFYDSKQDFDSFYSGYSRFYEAGLSNVPFDRINTVYADNITPAVQQAAYNAGLNDAKISLDVEKANAKYAKMYGKGSGFIQNEYSANVDKGTIDTLNTVAKAVGIKVAMDKSSELSNGWYSNGVVTITQGSNNPVFVVAKHEITHHIQKVSPKEYRLYRDYAVQITAGDQSIDTLVERYKAAAAEHDITLTTESAMDEIAADFTENILKDEKTLKDFINGNERTVVQKFFDAVRDFIDKVKKAFKGNKAEMDAVSRETYGATIEQLEHAEKLWKDALQSTQEKAAQTAWAKGSEAVQDSGNTQSGDIITAGDMKYSLKPRFEEQVDAALTYELEKDTDVFVAYTPEILQALGLQEYPVLMTQKHIRDAVHEKSKSNKKYHGLSVDTVKKLPEILENPVMILRSLTDKDSLVVVSSERDSDNLPVIVAIKPNWKGRYNRVDVVTNFAMSVYGRTGFESFINRTMDIDGVLYVNKKRTHSLFARSGLKMPQALNKDGFFTENISQSNSNVKYSLKDSSGRTLSQEQAEYFKDSKIRDNDGNLMVMYHGTPKGGFTVFNDYSYFTPAKEYARLYTHPGVKKESGDPQLYEVYLNITKPFDISNADAVKIYKDMIRDGSSTYIHPDTTDKEINSIIEKNGIDWNEADNIIEYLSEKELDYDGLVVNERVKENGEGIKGYIVFSPNQIKNIDNENPTSDPDIRFSLKKPVEESKNLIAVHNLSEEKLRSALELGGFPMPSIAITKKDMPHEAFGDISLLFYKDTISPTDRRNKVYGGDAWTPTFPSVEYKVSEKALKNLSSKINALLGNDSQAIRTAFGLMLDEDNASDMINRRSGSFSEAYRKNEALKIAFLREKGIPFRLVMKDHRYSREVDNVVLRRILRAIGADKIREAQNKSSQETMKFEPIVRKLYNDWISEKYANLEPKAIASLKKKEPLEWNELDSLLYSAMSYARGGEKKVVDDTATIDRIKKKFTKKLTAEYDVWIDELGKKVVEKKGIRNNKDYFTYSGNRRSFEQLHDDVTLNNIVKVMASEEMQKGGGILGTGNIYGASAKEYGSIAEIKADADRLTVQNEEEHSAIKDAYSDRLIEIVKRMVKPDDSGFGATLDAGDAVVDALIKGKTPKGILRELKKWVRFYSDASIANDIYNLAQDISNMPVMYFEAKPRRAVWLEEVAAAVIPRKRDKSFKEELERAGINVVEYNPNKEGDRLKKVNSVPDVAFSLKGQSDILKENAKLKEYNDYLKEQMKVTTFIKQDKKAVEKLARDLLKEHSSGLDQKELYTQLEGVYDYMANAEQPVWEELKGKAREVANNILSEAVVTNDELYQSYKGLRESLKKARITLSEEDRADLRDGYNEFRKANFGRLNLVNDGVPVNTAYNELAEQYPEFFDADQYTHPAEQLEHIADVLDSLRPFDENPYTYNMRNAAEWLADDIIDRFYSVPQAKKTFADKAEAKLTKQKIKDANKLERLREQKDKQIERIRTQSKERIQEAVKKEKAAKWEKVEQVRERQREKESRMSDKRKKSVLISKIKKHSAKISKMLLNPTETSHVPEPLRKPVGEFLSLLDLTTDRLGEKTLNRLYSLQREYQKVSDGKTDYYIEIDPDLIDNITQVIESVADNSDMRIVDMNIEDLNALYRATLAIERSIFSYNRIMREGQNATVAEYGEKAIGDLRTNKGYEEIVNPAKRWAADLLNMDMLAPSDYFEQLGDGMSDLYENGIRAGFDTKIALIKQAQDYIKDLTKGVNINEISGDKAKAKTFKLHGGTIDLTPAQVMSLYLLNKQEDAQKHIYGGGIKAAPTVARKGKGKRPKVIKSFDAIRILPEDVANIIGSLTEEQRKIADGISKFFTDYTAEWGNEVSLKLYGYRKFTVENYFPIVSDRNYITEVFGETNDATLKNMGSTKSRIKGANNPIIIEDVFDVFARQADAMSSYNAFVIPLTDIQKVYNYKTFDGSVKQAIEKKFGTRANKYFSKIMADINGGVRYTGGWDLLNTMISKYKQARVGMNIRVILQQPTSMIRATWMINPKYIAAALPRHVKYDIVKKYAPIAQWKDWGYFSIDTGKSMKNLILDKREISDVTMWAAKQADKLTWSRLWAAVELETKDKRKDLKVGTEEYYQYVGKRFSDIIDKTQVVDSTLHRPQIMRNPDTLVKMSVSFMSEPMRSYNMLRTALRNAKENPGKTTKQIAFGTSIAFASAIVVNHIITGFVDAMRGDDDDEFMLDKIAAIFSGEDEGDDEEEKKLTFKERWLKHFADNLANEPLSFFPFVKDIASIAQGYTNKRLDTAGIADLASAAKRAFSDKYTISFKIADLSAKIADLFGIPASSVKREVETAAKLSLGVKDDPAIEYHVSKAFYNVSSNKGKYMDILYKALKSGDTESYNYMVEDLINEGISGQYIESAMKSRAKKDSELSTDLDAFDSTFAGLGIKYENPEEKKEDDTFGVEDLNGSEYVEYAEIRGKEISDIISDFQNMGFGDLDDETANNLIGAAYTYANSVALQEASNGKYEEDRKWISLAQTADVDLGLSVAEYIDLKEKYGAAALDSNGAYNAYANGIDVELYLEASDFKSNTKADYWVDREGNPVLNKDGSVKTVSGSKKQKVSDYLNTLDITEEEYIYLMEALGYNPYKW